MYNLTDEETCPRCNSIRIYPVGDQDHLLGHFCPDCGYEEDSSEPDFPWLTACPFAIYGDPNNIHDPAKCDICKQDQD